MQTFSFSFGNFPNFHLLCYKLNFNTNRRMARNKKKAGYSQKEEKQAKKVLLIIGVSALILLLAMLIAYSFLG